MSRRDRRAAKKLGRGVIFVDLGRLQQGDKNYGLAVECYVCGKPHNALGLARIRDSRAADATTDVPLCESCLVSDAADGAVIRKYLHAPGLEVAEGGEATTEQIEALAGKQDKTEH